MIKRQRGRGRNPGQKPQNNNPNRAYESNGPDLKVRGSAQTVFEKYQQLGRDSMSNGDRVLGENYMQHAEHYFRVLRAMQPTFVPRSELMIAGYDDDYEDGEEGSGANGEATEGEGGDAQNSAQPEYQQNRQQRDNNRDNNRDGRDRDNNRDNNRDRPQRDFGQNREPREPRDPNEPRNDNRGEGEEGRFGRRRRRPDRFGNEGGYQGNGQGNNQGENNQGEGRREPRPDYRGEASPAPAAPVDVPASFAQPEFAQPSGFSNPQEIITAPEGGVVAPARERRPRPPRAPRPPRDAAPEAETGFGNELPAFLATSVPVSSGE